MKTKHTANLLPVMAAGLGTAALLGRWALFLVGNDQKGLLIPGHPLNILVWALTAAALLLITVTVLGLGGSGKYGDNFGPSTVAAIGCFVLAGGITVTVLFGWSTGARLELIRSIFGLLAIPALVVLGLHRWKGKRPFFLLHGIVCLYLILYSVSHYQLWSSRPQMQHWFFSMAGAICLTLFAYYQTAFDVSMGSRRKQLATGSLTGFFCLAALAGGEDLLLYLGGAVWALTNLCHLTPVLRRRPNPITETTREEAE